MNQHDDGDKHDVDGCVDGHMSAHVDGNVKASMTRRHWLSTSGKVIASGAALLAAPAFVRAQGEQPIKIGMVMAKQGVWTEQGVMIADGVKLAIADAGGQVRSRRIDLIWYDEPNPQGSQQNMQKLVDEDKVAAVIGGTNSGTSLAMASVAGRTRVPYISPGAAARELTGSSCNPYTFRTLAPIPVSCRALAPLLLTKGKRWHFLVANYAFGQDIQRAMSDLLKEAGGTVTGADASPLNTTDFSSFILKIRQAKPDVVVLGLPGGDLSTFLKQWAEMGMKGVIPVACPVIGDPDLWSISPEAATGYYGLPWHYDSPGLTPAEQAFVKTYTAQHNKPPSDKVWLGWFSTRVLLEAMKQAKSTSSNDIAASLETVKVDDGGTPAYYRQWDHQMVRHWTVFKVKDHITDKWNWLDRVSVVPQNMADVDKLYGTPAEIGCKMAPRSA